MNQNFLINKIGQEKLSFAKQFTVIRYFTDTLQVLYGIRYERLIHSSFASFCTKAAITEHQSSSSFAVSIFTGLWHFIAVHVYRKQIQQYSFIFNTKTNNCPYSCCEAKKDIGMIYLQVTYDQHVITATPKANVRLVHNNSQMEAWFLLALYVASCNLSQNCIPGLARQTSICLTLCFQSFSNATIRYRSHDWQNSQHMHNHQTHTASCD